MADQKRKLDLQRVLAAADSRDRGFYEGLNSDERDGFEPWLVMRWLSAVRGPVGEYYLRATNELVNQHFSALKDHPELQWLLMSRVGIGTKQRHEWVPPPKGRREDKVKDFLLQWYPGANDLELEILLNQFTDESFAEFVRATGMPEKPADALVAEYGRMHGKGKSTAKPATPKRGRGKV